MTGSPSPGIRAYDNQGTCIHCPEQGHFFQGGQAARVSLSLRTWFPLVTGRAPFAARGQELVLAAQFVDCLRLVLIVFKGSTLSQD